VIRLTSPALAGLALVTGLIGPATADPATAVPVRAEPTVAGPVTARTVPERSVARTIPGFDSPESVLHDRVTDSYLVSNIGGVLPTAATARDGDGFISRLAPDGAVRDRFWIGRGKDGVRLNSPKGLAVSGQVLYVADITRVRMFNRFSGRPLGSVSVPGSVFLNDLATAPDGAVHVSDTAVRVSADGQGFEETLDDAIYRVSARGRVSVVAKGPWLGSPNGLAFDGRGRLLVAPFDTSREIYTPDPDGTRRVVARVPIGQLDGLEVKCDGTLLVSGFETPSVYALAPDGASSQVYTGQQPADLGYDARRDRLLLPLIYDDAVLIQPLTGSGT
jgi:hypothetical protein